MATTLQPAQSEAFQRALAAHSATLSPAERNAFVQAHGSAEVAVAMAARCDDDHRLRSKSRRFAGVIGQSVQGLKRYFHVVDTCVSSHPEVAALVWGGVKLAIEVFLIPVHIKTVGCLFTA